MRRCGARQSRMTPPRTRRLSVHSSGLLQQSGTHHVIDQQGRDERHRHLPPGSHDGRGWRHFVLDKLQQRFLQSVCYFVGRLSATMFRTLLSASAVRASTGCSSLSNNLRSRSVANGGIRAWLSTDNVGMYDKITFLGAGRMAHAMIAPLIKKGYQPEEKVCVYDVSNAAMTNMKEEFPNIQYAESITNAVRDSDLIVLAVKPQNINDAFFEQFPKDMRKDSIMVSILAGKPISEFEPSGISKICRAMPNTPAMIGEGMTVWSCTPNLTSVERGQIKKIMGTFGKEVSRSAEGCCTEGCLM